MGAATHRLDELRARVSGTDVTHLRLPPGAIQFLYEGDGRERAGDLSVAICGKRGRQTDSGPGAHHTGAAEAGRQLADRAEPHLSHPHRRTLSVRANYSAERTADE